MVGNNKFKNSGVKRNYMSKAGPGGLYEQDEIDIAL